MNRIALLAPCVALSLLTGGCWNGFLEGGDPGAACTDSAPLGLAQPPIRSEGGDYMLYGACPVLTACEHVVMAGTELFLRVDGAESQQPIEGHVLTSGSPGTVTVTPSPNACDVPKAYATTNATGQGSILLADGETTVDTFELEVAEATHLSIFASSAEDLQSFIDDAVAAPASIDLAVGQHAIVVVHAMDADDRVLGTGTSGTWTSSDPAVASFDGDDDGSMVIIEGAHPGTATITAAIGELTTTLVVDVRQ